MGEKGRIQRRGSDCISNGLNGEGGLYSTSRMAYGKSGWARFLYEWAVVSD
jgi:hypothetical protein